MIAIKNWFLEKNKMKGFYGKELEVIKETAKAALIRTWIDGERFEEWVPKSVIIDCWEKDTSNFGYHDSLVNVYKKNVDKDQYIHVYTTKKLVEVLERNNISFMNRADWNNR